MLTQLSTVKARLDLLDGTHDAFLTSAIAALSARFDRIGDPGNSKPFLTSTSSSQMLGR